ncbi:MAG TPA: ABC transporter permease subunit [Candidatus Eisenbergiella merdigallinarum]|uniref:ABC transporter permease subunit n=1 Tax=Candidatus Eisenbergiella merdigallinarum TaxID=2838552 RepID=A0A9D2MPE5_9FIRM|nr:ABC transporter permease subunit [Candidatus Eisenbergiella merdigallinarum]
MKKQKKSRWFYFKKNLPLTMMALPGIILMILFKYLPLSGIVLAFKQYNIRDGIFGSAWNGLKNFEYLFRTKDAWIITRNTLGYNLMFIVLDLVLAVTMAIILNELHQKRAAKVYQTIFMAPYFLSWVVVSFIAYSLLSVDNGFINRALGLNVTWYSQTSAWPVILVVFQIWKTLGYSTVMYLGSIVGISNDYYEAALMDGATKWQQIKYITLPSLKGMMIVLTILAIGKIFYADFGLFYQLPRNSGPLFPVTNVIDTYVYRALKENGNIGMSAAASLYQSLVGFVLVLTSNFIVRKIDPDSALF